MAASVQANMVGELDQDLADALGAELPSSALGRKATVPPAEGHGREVFARICLLAERVPCTGDDLQGA